MCDLDYADGRLSGICFQYKDDEKEWMVFGARTIFPFRSKLKKRKARAINIDGLVTNSTIESTVESDGVDDDDSRSFQAEPDRSEINDEPEPMRVLGEEFGDVDAIVTTSPTRILKQRSDPTNVSSFVVGGK